jgi:uncharacterized protein YndB with AHSA1/START domain
MSIPETSLFLKRTFAAPRAKVFEAWTKPEALLNWFAVTPDHVPSVAEVDLRVGGRYRIGMKHRPTGNEHIATGVYQEVVTNERLVFTWRWETTMGRRRWISSTSASRRKSWSKSTRKVG